MIFNSIIQEVGSTNFATVHCEHQHETIYPEIFPSPDLIKPKFGILLISCNNCGEEEKNNLRSVKQTNQSNPQSEMSQMLSLEERVKISMRRGSAVPIMKNPLESSRSSSSDEPNIKVSASIDSRPITPVESLDLITRLRTLQSEVSRFLEYLDNVKNPFLFHSDDLLQMLALTDASKTKLSILTMIVPKLIDPRASFDQVNAMFRFADEKAIVEELFKERIQIVNASLFRKVDKTNNILAPGRTGGRGGVGGRGFRATTIGRPLSLPTNLTEETVTIFTPTKTSDSLCNHDTPRIAEGGESNQDS